ncbi:MAG: hypothetical protein ACRDFA_10945 [bacterium]
MRGRASWNSMSNLIKRLITTFTFRDGLSSKDEVRFLRLRLDSEGAGRFFVLTDECEGCEKKGCEIYFNTPDDVKMLWEAAREMWEQGALYHEEDL